MGRPWSSMQQYQRLLIPRLLSYNTVICLILQIRHISFSNLHNRKASFSDIMYSGRINILVATDIVARGIDIDDIRLVINFDVPHDSEDYVHRIGRTARANNDGVALTFISEKEQSNFKSIENFLEKEIYKIPVPAELGEAPEYKPRSYNNKRGDSSKRRSFGGKRNNNNGKKGNNRPSSPARN